MKKKLTMLFIIAFTSINVNAQYARLTSDDDEYGEILAVLNEWCDEYFDSCFNWKFVELLDETVSVTRIKSGKWKANGTNKNQGIASNGQGAKTYIREFKATIERMEAGRYKVFMKKEQTTWLLGTQWLECTMTIEL